MSSARHSEISFPVLVAALMAAVSNNGTATVKLLSADLQRTGPQVGEVMQRLEEEGLAERTEDGVTITERGEDLGKLAVDAKRDAIQKNLRTGAPYTEYFPDKWSS